MRTLALGLCLGLGLAQKPTPRLDVEVDKSGAYAVTLDGLTWAQGGPVALTVGSEARVAGDGGLELVEGPEFEDDELCSLGPCRRTWMTWSDHADGLMETSFEIYSDGVIVYEQSFPKGLQGTAVKGGTDPAAEKDLLSTSFPAFVAQEGLKGGPAGVLHFAGKFMKDTRSSPWGPRTNITSGEESGPFVLFDAHNDNAVITSTFSNFMTGSQTAVTDQSGYITVGLGLLGSVLSVPPGYSLKFISVLGDGVTDAVLNWGKIMRAQYGKSAVAGYERDISLRYLGYATDNGAYYYYHTEDGVNYEETLEDVHDYAEKIGVPYKYILIDSWWYLKGAGSGVKDWTEQPDVFPSGFQAFHERTGWALWLHNRRWSVDNVYDEANGGRYTFLRGRDDLDDGEYSVPNDQRLWDDLMLNKSTSGMQIYEQDWLYNEFHGVSQLLQSPTLAREWLLQMGKGADKVNAAIQYCMEIPKFVLQSLEIPAVTQARASDDYHPGKVDDCEWPTCQWYQGHSALLLQAVGLAPSKDDFWTTADQPGNPKYKPTDVETHSEFLGAVAAYSTGPVQPADAVGKSDADLILRTSTGGGLLLQPSRPMTAIDACFLQEALGGDAGPKPRYRHLCPVLSTHTALPNLPKFLHVMSAQLAADYMLTASDVAADVTPGADYVFWRAADSPRRAAASGVSVSVIAAARAGDDFTVTLPACRADDFGLLHAAPLLALGGGDRAALLGEVAKFVPVASQRVRSVTAGGGALSVAVAGEAREEVTLVFYDEETGATPTATCTLSEAGTATVTFGPEATACTCA